MTSQVNPFELILIQEDLKKQGIVEFDAHPGNDCVWVRYGLINCYYIFRNGKIADVQFD